LLRKRSMNRPIPTLASNLKATRLLTIIGIECSSQ
jgi:hypothetical protein